MSGQPLRLVGAGHWGTRYALTIHAPPGVALRWVASRRERLPASAFVGVAHCAHWSGLPLAQIDAAIIANATGEQVAAAAFCLGHL